MKPSASHACLLTLVMGTGLGATASAFAQANTNVAKADVAIKEGTVPAKAEVGTTSRRWLQAQGQHEQASLVQPTLSGPVMHRVHERYLKSFERPIPDKLGDDSPVSTSK
jgi:hypothetical protein